ncbi:MAG: hydrogenase nickel incorporation protein HypB [Methylococcales bacterium]|nr:hydrogenase nickel incorporation protein HypB [Methylococcales bacterium]MDP3840938.1 hydrogenase nickel incorporation protein HypB [Methylococcales bacterium]
MCGICGCGSSSKSKFSPLKPHHHHHDEQDSHDHAHESHGERLIRVEQDILAKNDSYADENRAYFQQHGIFALNFVSSPGAGKTTLLVATINALKNTRPIFVIEGDQQTDLDADRIRATGVAAVQINTGKACHLDAYDIGQAVQSLSVPDNSLLAIENVGNLVCPSSFDLGEAHKVVVLSVTEGDDKPLKYPDMFHAADLMIINKIDLLPYTNFDVARCIEFAKRINPDIEVLQLSATQEPTLTAWLDWLDTPAA